MTAPGNDFLVLALSLGILLSSAYAIGRIHQWDRHGLERDDAYRLGYDKASYSIIDMIGLQDTPGDEKSAATPRADLHSLTHHQGRHVRERRLIAADGV